MNTDSPRLDDRPRPKLADMKRDLDDTIQQLQQQWGSKAVEAFLQNLFDEFERDSKGKLEN